MERRIPQFLVAPLVYASLWFLGAYLEIGPMLFHPGVFWPWLMKIAVIQVATLSVLWLLDANARIRGVTYVAGTLLGNFIVLMLMNRPGSADGSYQWSHHVQVFTNFLPVFLLSALGAMVAVWLMRRARPVA